MMAFVNLHHIVASHKSIDVPSVSQSVNEATDLS